MYFGKGIRVKCFFAVFAIPAILLGQTGKSVNLVTTTDHKALTVTTKGNDFTIHYSLPGLSLRSIDNQFGEFYRLSSPGHSRSSETGKPELPVLSRLITVPENSTVNCRISDVRTEVLKPGRTDIRGMLYPRQPDATKTQDRQRTGFMIDREVYSGKGSFGFDTVRIEYLGKFRGIQLATIMISPARYNPRLNEIEVITSMKIEVSFSGSEVKSSSGAASSQQVSEPLAKGLLNYSEENLITGFSDKPVGMIILTDTIFSRYLEPLVRWKTQKGFRVSTLYKGTQFAGNTFSELRDTIRKIYLSSSDSNPAPDYLLIAGSVDIIPESDVTSQVSDTYYGEFDGNGDYIPDMFIGRIPAADTNEMKAVVNKILQYEMFQFADTNRFYDRALVTAGNDAGYATYMNGQVNYASKYYIREENRIEDHVFNYPQSATAEDTIKKLVNGGVSFINYSGHGDISGWLDPVIKVADVAQFRNKNMYPFVISNACQTAHYNLANSFGNRMLLSADKGAIGFIGCSNDSYWDEDYYWALGVGAISSDPKYEETGLGAYDRLFHTHGEKAGDWYITMGQVNFAGNLSVSASTSSKKKYYWETYTLLGDPSIIPYIGTPDTFNIAVPDTLPNGIRSLSMTIDPFAYIAVSRRDTLIDASHASPSGSVVLELPEISNDSCLFVISGQNMVPLIKTVYFGNIEDEYINLTSASVNDPDGNNNSRADFGETFFISLAVSNLGLTGASNLYVKISSTSPWITILNDSVFIGTINAGSQVISADKLLLKVNALIPDRGYATINIVIRDDAGEKVYLRDLPLHAPVLDILSCVIDDTGTGNGDLTADPGETLKLMFSVRNKGSSSIEGTFNITNSPAGVTINQPSVSTGRLEAGSTTVIPVSVSLSPTLLKGTSFDAATLLDCDPYFGNKSFSIAVGKTRESFEYQSFKIFPWQNSSSYPWIINNSQAYEGQFSARSASVSHSSESPLSILVNVPAPDTLRFFYKVSSEKNYDFLIFKLNGTQIFKASGEVEWTGAKAGLREGFNRLEWIYRKDESVTSGNDCAWIDYITFPASSYNRVDLKTGKIVNPQPNKSYAQETITAQVINFGSDTVKTFNLAYRINDLLPVTEQFTKKINPSDTVDVAFTVTANMAFNGTYLISVYGFSNNDSFMGNDTARLTIINTSVTPVENPENPLRIMPNPFTSSFRIMLDSPVGEIVRIGIYDAAGRLMWEEEKAIMPGNNIHTVSPAALSPGYYTVKIRGKSIYKASRLIKN